MLGSWGKNKGMIVQRSVVNGTEITGALVTDWSLAIGIGLGLVLANSLPRISLHMNMSLFHVRIFIQKVLGQKNGKLFGTLNAVFLSQQIDGILLGISCHNVGVVALVVVLFAVQLQVGAHLVLLDGVHWSFATHMQHLYRILAITMIRNFILKWFFVVIHAGGLLLGLAHGAGLSQGNGKHSDCNHSLWNTDYPSACIPPLYTRVIWMTCYVGNKNIAKKAYNTINQCSHFWS